MVEAGRTYVINDRRPTDRQTTLRKNL